MLTLGQKRNLGKVKKIADRYKEDDILDRNYTIKELYQALTGQTHDEGLIKYKSDVKESVYRDSLESGEKSDSFFDILPKLRKFKPVSAVMIALLFGFVIKPAYLVKSLEAAEPDKPGYSQSNPEPDASGAGPDPDEPEPEKKPKPPKDKGSIFGIGAKIYDNMTLPEITMGYDFGGLDVGFSFVYGEKSEQLPDDVTATDPDPVTKMRYKKTVQTDIDTYADGLSLNVSKDLSKIFSIAGDIGVIRRIDVTNTSTIEEMYRNSELIGQKETSQSTVEKRLLPKVMAWLKARVGIFRIRIGGGAVLEKEDEKWKPKYVYGAGVDLRFSGGKKGKH